MTVLIAGGGIGGLTLALSLHQIGVPARVFESVPELRPLGVGINVLPIGARIHRTRPARQARCTPAVRTKELAYFSKHGKPIWSEPRGIEAGYKWPQFSIHRGTLQQILLDAAIERLGKENISPAIISPAGPRRKRRARRIHRQGDRQIARRFRRRDCSLTATASIGGSAKPLSRRRSADLERAHPWPAASPTATLPVRPHHDHGRPRNAEIRLLSDFQTG